MDPLTISPDRAHREYLRHADNYVHDSKRILDDWDAYSDEHTDLDGWPHDNHSYGIRAGQRDADTYTAFENVRDGARHLLVTAETQLARLPAHAVQSRWVYQLGVLHSALDGLEALAEQWLETQDSLPGNAQPGSAAFDHALAEHHAESWSYLDDWGSHGHTLREINTAARHAPSPLAPAPSTTPAIAPARTHSVRK